MTSIFRTLSLAAIFMLYHLSLVYGEIAINASPCEGLIGPQPILRQDFTDVPILGCLRDPRSANPAPLNTALGARASYTYDDIHGASGASLDGLAALNFQYTRGELAQYISNISFGPYAQGSGNYASATKNTPASTSGMVTTGGYVQFIAEEPIPVIFRLRGGELNDNTGVQDRVAVGEFIPVFQIFDLVNKQLVPESLGNFGFGTVYQFKGGIKLIFSPEIEAQYDSYQGGPLTYNLFASRHEAMRVGPLMILKVYGFESFGLNSFLKKRMERLVISISYHADWDTFSCRKYYNFQPAIIYNLNEKGTLALTASYSIGDSEFTGNKTRLLKAAFSAKF